MKTKRITKGLIKKAKEKVKKIKMSPEERQRHRNEIKEILELSKKEKEEKERERKAQTTNRPFSFDVARSLIRGLKFKKEDKIKPDPMPETDKKPLGIKDFKDSGTIKKQISSYEKWYRLVTMGEGTEDIPETENLKRQSEIELTKPENKTNEQETEIPIDVTIIKTIFDKKASSYKYFWFMSIISLAKETEILSIKYSDISIRMAAMAWPIVFESEIDLGSKDLMKTYLEEVVRKTSLTKTASSIVVEKYLLQHYTSQGINKVLSPLMKNVPYRFLSPWIKYTTDEEVILKSQDKQFTGMYALYNENILLDEAWWDYIRDNYADICAFTIKSFLQYVKPINSDFQLIKLKTFGWPLIGSIDDK